MPRVSIITPTKDRQELLPALWDCVRAQSEQDFEWLVHDGSPQRASIFDAIDDPRVRYMHLPGQMRIGAKRNALCDAAKGEIIAHFDDDDFYGPRYIDGNGIIHGRPTRGFRKALRVFPLSTNAQNLRIFGPRERFPYSFPP